ncbi:MAG: hypothetical protein IMX02_02825 [Limnochordaceae bacterium]|nr:hypothetical protein [Limnochordaceae bacterium]
MTPPDLDGVIHRFVIRVGEQEYIRDVGCSGTKLAQFMHHPDPDEPGWTKELAGIGMCAAAIKMYLGVKPPPEGEYSVWNPVAIWLRDAKALSEGEEIVLG